MRNAPPFTSRLLLLIILIMTPLHLYGAEIRVSHRVLQLGESSLLTVEGGKALSNALTTSEQTLKLNLLGSSVRVEG